MYGKGEGDGGVEWVGWGQSPPWPPGGRHMSTHVKELVYFFGRLPVEKNIPLDLRGFGDENNPKSKIETPLDGLRKGHYFLTSISRIRSTDYCLHTIFMLGKCGKTKIDYFVGNEDN